MPDLKQDVADVGAGFSFQVVEDKRMPDLKPEGTEVAAVSQKVEAQAAVPGRFGCAIRIPATPSR